MQGMTYTVDIAMCIDVTGSMSGLIEKVNANALRFYEDLAAIMSEKGRVIDQLRVRVIAFRDFYTDGDSSLQSSDFFLLPDESARFAEFVSSLHADGGGDAPETGLEALALAFRSKWSATGDKRRQVVVMWTDTSPHPLEKNAGSKPGSYPAGLPGSFDELTDEWEGQEFVNLSAKRLVAYAPDAYAWTDIGNHWSNVVHYPSQAGAGLSEVDYGTILDAIANSV